MNIDIEIRSIRREDVTELMNIRTMGGVRETILSVATERLESGEKFLASFTANDHMLVAEVDCGGTPKMVGAAGLHVASDARMRHVGTVGIMVHCDWQGKGDRQGADERVARSRRQLADAEKGSTHRLYG